MKNVKYKNSKNWDYKYIYSENRQNYKKNQNGVKFFSISILLNKYKISKSKS